MSRIGKKPVEIPAKVTAKITGTRVEIKGPRGSLVTTLHPEMSVAIDNGHLVVSRPSDEKRHKALHGLSRKLLANAVVGVTEGFKRELDIVGVGYKAEVKDRKVVFALGYSHPVVMPIPKEIEISIDKATHLVVSGVDKQQVGQVAAEIRGLRLPDPYKGKGVKYSDEVIRRKVGKAGGK